MDIKEARKILMKNKKFKEAYTDKEARKKYLKRFKDGKLYQDKRTTTTLTITER